MTEEIESQRKYWNQESEKLQKIYSHEKSRLSNWLDRVFRKDMYDRFVFTIDRCSPYQRRTFLDVGCGNGLYTIELAKKGAARVVGLDIAERMIESCRGLARKEQVENRCEFEHTDLNNFKPTQNFDISIGIGLFDYVRDPIPVLQRMRNLTRDKIIVSFPRLWTWRAPIRKFRLNLKGCDVYFYTRKKVERALKEAGFNDLAIYVVGKLYCVIARENSGFVPDESKREVDLPLQRGR